MVIDYYDTSALLAKPELIKSNYDNYISHFVIKELEDIKQSSNKSEDIKASARSIARLLLGKASIRTNNIDYRKLSKIKKHNPWLPQNTDGDIIAEAMLLRDEGNQVCFWTADYNMYLFARDVVNYINFVETEAKKEIEPWSGWGKYYPNEKDMNILYSEPTINVLDAKINEYCEIFEGSELKDVLRWDGEKYCKLKYKEITSAVGQKWKPLNIEQKMLFDLLQNDNIPVKLALGNFGSGKTSLMLSHALDMVQRGKMDKIIFIRNNIEVKDTVPLGALPNDETSKLFPFLMPIADHVGMFTFEDMLNQNIIEPCHLGFIRGRDFKNSILFIDESENLTSHQVQLLIGRIGKGSMLFMAGDLRQTDKINFQKNSGILRMIDRLQDNPLFGMVKLQQSVRSEVCKLADLMD